MQCALQEHGLFQSVLLGHLYYVLPLCMLTLMFSNVLQSSNKLCYETFDQWLKKKYWVPQKLPQIYAVIAYICIWEGCVIGSTYLR